MNKNKILFILVQIDEAHSSAWPTGLENQPEPQKNITDRLQRANDFVNSENVPIEVYVDTWDNNFAEIYHAWPDKYYHFDKQLNILTHSEYGIYGDENAKIKLDCLDLISNLLE